MARKEYIPYWGLEEMEGKMKTLIVCFFSMVFCTSALANLHGSDDFNDNVMDPVRWSVGLGDSLTETNSRLEYSGGFGEAGGAWLWELNSGSYVQDWAVSLDVDNSVDEATLSDQQIHFGLIALNPETADNTFSVGLSVADDAGGSGPRRYIGTQADVNQEWVFSHEEETTETSLQLKISFDASAKVLTSYYDSGSGLTALTNFHVGSWGMTDSDVFTLAIYGDSTDVTAVSGEVFGDNFAAIPEPGTLALLGVALAGMLLARRKDRKINIPHSGV